MFFNVGQKKMRALLVAFLFASIVIVATNLKTTDIQFMNVDQIQAQGESYTIVVKKVVNGSTPDSDWEFEGSNPIGAFTIDKAGGDKTFYLTRVEKSTITITEMTKSNFNAYGRGYAYGGFPTFTMTHAVTVIASFCGTEHWYAEFSNNYLPSSQPLSHPVGGATTSANKFSILAPYLALAVLTGVILSLTVINKRLVST